MSQGKPIAMHFKVGRLAIHLLAGLSQGSANRSHTRREIAAPLMLLPQLRIVQE